MTTPAEKIQQQIEKLAKKMAQAQAREQLKAARDKTKDANAKRKADTRAKIELGGLVIKAGLGDKDKGALLGALLALAKTEDAARWEAWKRAGDEALAS